ncbi:MAG: Kae1-associated serine/threonine protein kinase [Nanoarchaeota archaeon]|nr:Kae1-associated serine/threonine protein kinase [Nanoarchaeota archaeon]MBU4033128.1 Kae1-associated serine/threonine protein kinase [Candidatus Thermoplasmatota archaeon]MBU4123989.1 Kae1-associated serine/threonine protein kinase [Nanoarchaeota archaeon]
MNIIKRGAEGILYKEGDVLVKERIKKGYRIKEIDERLRKERTKKESKLLSEARRSNVPTPNVFEVSEFKIKMEFIDGVRIKELIYNETSDKKRIAEEIGQSVGRLHSNNIIHGDLTTSNMIMKDSKIFFIDFGLGYTSTRNEDFGIDLSVLKEAFKSTHVKYIDILWQSFIKGYKQTNTNSKQVLKTLEEIERRGRYIKRES